MFAGIRLGFEQASKQGIECVFISEWDKYSTETYKANFGSELIYGDITQVSLNDIPEHDILLVWFPWQPFP